MLDDNVSDRDSMTIHFFHNGFRNTEPAIAPERRNGMTYSNNNIEKSIQNRYLYYHVHFPVHSPVRVSVPVATIVMK